MGWARGDAVTDLHSLVVGAAAISSGDPPPPTPSLVGLTLTTMPLTTSTLQGQPPREAEAKPGWVVMPMAAIPMAPAAAVVMSLVTMTAVTVDGALTMTLVTDGDLMPMFSIRSAAVAVVLTTTTVFGADAMRTTLVTMLTACWPDVGWRLAVNDGGLTVSSTLRAVGGGFVVGAAVMIAVRWRLVLMLLVMTSSSYAPAPYVWTDRTPPQGTPQGA